MPPRPGPWEPVHLERKEVLFRAYEPLRVVYFPDCSVVSFVSRLESGETLEVGLAGRDGLAGTAVFPGITTMSCVLPPDAGRTVPPPRLLID